MLFKKLLLSDMITIILSGALSTYLYWYAYQIALDQSLIGLVGLGQLLGVLFASLGGGLADRYNKVSFIKWVTLARLVLILLLIMALPHFSQDLLLASFMLLSTICGNLLSPTMEALLPYLSTSDDDLYRLNAQLSSLTQVAGLFALILSALYVAFLPLTSVLWISLGLSVLAVLSLLGTGLEMANASQSVLANIKQGIAYIFQTTYIRALVPIALVMNFAFWSVFLLLPKLTVDYFGFFKPAYSVLEICFALGGILGGWYFSKKLANFADKFRLFWLGLLAQSSCLLLLALSLLLSDQLLSYLFVLLAWFGYAFANTIVSIVYFSAVQLKGPQDILGSVIGSILTIFSLVNPVAALVSDKLIQLASLPVLMIGFAGLMLILSISVSRLETIQQAFV